MQLPDRYRKVRTLGEGGSGSALLVQDRRSGEHVALKFLSLGGEEPELLAPLFQNEFRTLAQFRHPRVVPVHDFGYADGQPYFTMAFVPGETGRSFVREDRLAQPDIVRLAALLLEALDYIHARGVVHRDVKPENLIVRRGEGGLEPVLIDFGLAVAAGGGRPGRAAGTLPYVAPEVLRGERARPAADQFALGMVLFEVATGRPFAPPGELLREPERLLAAERVRQEYRAHARGAAPRRLEEVIARLVAPRPRDRFATAGEALQLLARFYDPALAAGLEEAAAARVEIEDPPLAGRAGAMTRLMERVDRLVADRLAEPVMVVAGPAGIGVSRVLAAMRNEAAFLGCDTLLANSLHGLARDTAHVPGVDASCEGTDPAEVVFRIDHAISELPPRRRIVVALDDVHAASDAEVAALRGWVRALERRDRPRVLLVLGGRNAGAAPGAELLRTAGRAVPVETRELAPLDARDIRAVLRGMTGLESFPGELVPMLERATGGNPRLLVELVRVLVQEAVLDLSGDAPRLDDGKLKGLDLPAGVEEATRRRVRALPKPARDAAALLALVETPLGAPAAHAVAGKHLERLEREGLLVRDRGRIRFDSELTRRGADLLEGAARRTGWKKVAARIGQLEPAAAAMLHLDAGDLDPARRVGVPAARALLDARRLEPAIDLLRGLVGDPPDPELAFLLSDALFDQGRREEAAAIADRAASHGGGNRALFQAAQAYSAIKDADRALHALDRVKGEEVRVALARASTFLQVARPDDALGALDAVEWQGAADGGRRDFLRARALQMLGRYRSAANITRNSISGSRTTEQRRASGLQGLGTMRQAIDPAVQTLRTFAQSRRIGRRLRWTNLMTEPGVMAAAVFIEVGRHRSTARLLDLAGRRYGATGQGSRVADAFVFQAVARLLQGDALQAENLIARADATPGSESLQPELAYARLVLSRVTGRPMDEPELPDKNRYVRMDTALELAEAAAAREDVEEAERRWRRALQVAWATRYPRRVLDIRIGLAECAAARGTWGLAERLLGQRDYARLRWRTPATTRAALVRAGAAVHRNEPALAQRLIERALDSANHCPDAPTRAFAYTRIASLLQEPELRKWLRQNTDTATRELLEAARGIWLEYGNSAMLKKIDLQLSELPQGTASADADGPLADKLVRILHVTREMNEEFDRDRLLRLILDRAVELTGAERGFIVLLREGREDMHIARNLDREAVPEPERKVSTRIIDQVLRTGRVVRTEDAEEDERFDEYLSVHDLKLRSIIALPLRSRGKTIGLVYLDNRHRVGLFTAEAERVLELFADQAVAAIDKARLVRELEERKEVLERHDRELRSELRRQGHDLDRSRREVKRQRSARGWGFDRIVTREPHVEGLVREAKRAARSNIPVLLLGESGTGKEAFARAMHMGSARRDMPFIALDCATFDDKVLERELFGHVRAGEEADRVGFLEEADGGALYLASIEALPKHVQAGVIDALERRELRRIGSNDPRRCDVRLFAGTSEDVDELVRAGRLRKDFVAYASQFALHLPPLRERRKDIEPLARAVVKELARREGRPELTITNEAIGRLEGHGWPGNVAELRKILARAAMDCEDESIAARDIRFHTLARTVLPSLGRAEVQRVRDELRNRGLKLNARPLTAIEWMLADGKLTYGAYRRRFQISKSTAARDLDQLTNAGVFEKRGRTRAVNYLPGPVLREIVNRMGL